MAAPQGQLNIVAGNWKMNLGCAASAALAGELITKISVLKRSSVWLAPSAIALEATAKAVAGSAIKIGAQNVHQAKSGAFTGEISVAMAREVSCSFSLIGHSERRSLFCESNTQCAERALGALSQELIVVFCIGETLAEREAGQTLNVAVQQLQPLLSAIKPGDVSKLIIAYEPVWAIGTGKVASTEQIAETHHQIDQHVRITLGADCYIPILYGGSVTADNFAEIIKLDHVSGALVGGASLSIEKFSPLIDIAEAS